MNTPAICDLTLIKQDLQSLHVRALQNPKGPEANLLRVALSQIDRIVNHGGSTHDLVAMPSYPDLSDCKTNYVGADPYTKPSHRIIWREMPPAHPGGRPVRQLIALGERAHGAAYHLAGQRLGRPVGVSLQELSAQPEPIRHRSAPTPSPRDQEIEL